MLNCPLIEAERSEEHAFDQTLVTGVTSLDDLSSEFPWLADTGNDIYEITKNLGGNNGTSALANRK